MIRYCLACISMSMQPTKLALEPSSAARGEPGTLVPALLGAVHADADDIGARNVLADALLERNDPRGEFMALSLQYARCPNGGSPARHRMKRLLAEHEDEWLGQHLVRMLTRRVWHQGMLDRAELVPRRLAPEAWAAWEAADDDRSSTLRALEQGATATPDFVAFVARRGLGGLRSISEQSRTEPLGVFLDALQRVKLPCIRTLRVTSCSRLCQVRQLGVVAEVSLPSLAHLVLLALPREGAGGLADALLHAPSFRRLEAVHVVARQHSGPRLDARTFVSMMADGARFRRFGLSTNDATVTVERLPSGLAIELQSEGRGFDVLGNLPNVERIVVASAKQLADPAGLRHMLHDLRPRAMVLPKAWRTRETF